MPEDASCFVEEFKFKTMLLINTLNWLNISIPLRQVRNTNEANGWLFSKNQLSSVRADNNKGNRNCF